MSKVWRGVKKAFRKVVKVAKKVVPIVLAAVAIYFTAGAALGISGTAGGWTAAAGKIGAVFGEGALGATMTGAITQAGYGAAIGGVISKASGGSFTQGAQAGALTGAITGGVMGYAGYTPPPVAPEGGAPLPTGGLQQGGIQPVDPSAVQHSPFDPGVPAGPDASAFAGTDSATGGFTGYDQAAVQPASGAPGPVSAADAASLSEIAVTSSTAPSAWASRAPDGIFKSAAKSFFGKDGFLQRNQTLVGGAVQGIGMGLSANAEVEGNMAMMQERKRLTDANYLGTDPGQNYRALAGGTNSDRYDPRSYGSWQYEYDATQGRIIKVPAE